jgi:hypothetical protein
MRALEFLGKSGRRGGHDAEGRARRPRCSAWGMSGRARIVQISGAHQKIGDRDWTHDLPELIPFTCLDEQEYRHRQAEGVAPLAQTERGRVEPQVHARGVDEHELQYQGFHGSTIREFVSSTATGEAGLASRCQLVRVRAGGSNRFWRGDF